MKREITIKPDVLGILRPRIEKRVGGVRDIRHLMPAVFGLIKNVVSGTKKPRFDFQKGIEKPLKAASELSTR